MRPSANQQQYTYMPQSAISYRGQQAQSVSSIPINQMQKGLNLIGKPAEPKHRFASPPPNLNQLYYLQPTNKPAIQQNQNITSLINSEKKVQMNSNLSSAQKTPIIHQSVILKQQSNQIISQKQVYDNRNPQQLQQQQQHSQQVDRNKLTQNAQQLYEWLSVKQQTGQIVVPQQQKQLQQVNVLPPGQSINVSQQQQQPLKQYRVAPINTTIQRSQSVQPQLIRQLSPQNHQIIVGHQITQSRKLSRSSSSSSSSKSRKQETAEQRRERKIAKRKSRKAQQEELERQQLVNQQLSTMHFIRTVTPIRVITQTQSIQFPESTKQQAVSQVAYQQSPKMPLETPRQTGQTLQNQISSSGLMSQQGKVSDKKFYQIPSSVLSHTLSPPKNQIKPQIVVHSSPNSQKLGIQTKTLSPIRSTQQLHLANPQMQRSVVQSGQIQNQNVKNSSSSQLVYKEQDGKNLQQQKYVIQPQTVKEQQQHQEEIKHAASHLLGNKQLSEKRLQQSIPTQQSNFSFQQQQQQQSMTLQQSQQQKQNSVQPHKEVQYIHQNQSKPKISYQQSNTQIQQQSNQGISQNEIPYEPQNNPKQHQYVSQQVVSQASIPLSHIAQQQSSTNQRGQNVIDQTSEVSSHFVGQIQKQDNQNDKQQQINSNIQMQSQPVIVQSTFNKNKVPDIQSLGDINQQQTALIQTQNQQQSEHFLSQQSIAQYSNQNQQENPQPQQQMVYQNQDQQQFVEEEQQQQQQQELLHQQQQQQYQENQQYDENQIEQNQNLQENSMEQQECDYQYSQDQQSNLISSGRPQFLNYQDIHQNQNQNQNFDQFQIEVNVHQEGDQIEKQNQQREEEIPSYRQTRPGDSPINRVQTDQNRYEQENEENYEYKYNNNNQEESNDQVFNIYSNTNIAPQGGEQNEEVLKIYQNQQQQHQHQQQQQQQQQLVDSHRQQVHNQYDEQYDNQEKQGQNYVEEQQQMQNNNQEAYYKDQQEQYNQNQDNYSNEEKVKHHQPHNEHYQYNQSEMQEMDQQQQLQYLQFQKQQKLHELQKQQFQLQQQQQELEQQQFYDQQQQYQMMQQQQQQNQPQFQDNQNEQVYSLYGSNANQMQKIDEESEGQSIRKGSFDQQSPYKGDGISEQNGYQGQHNTQQQDQYQYPIQEEDQEYGVGVKDDLLSQKKEDIMQKIAYIDQEIKLLQEQNLLEDQEGFSPQYNMSKSQRNQNKPYSYTVQEAKSISPKRKSERQKVDKLVDKIAKETEKKIKSSLKNSNFKHRGVYLYEKALLNNRKKQSLEEINKYNQEKLARSKCTFKPKLNNQKHQFQNFDERNQRWQENKEFKILEMRMQQEEQDYRECTFTPDQTHSQSFYSKHLFNRNRDSMIKGSQYTSNQNIPYQNYLNDQAHQCQSINQEQFQLQQSPEYPQNTNSSFQNLKTSPSQEGIASYNSNAEWYEKVETKIKDRQKQKYPELFQPQIKRSNLNSQRLQQSKYSEPSLRKSSIEKLSKSQKLGQYAQPQSNSQIMRKLNNNGENQQFQVQSNETDLYVDTHGRVISSPKKVRNTVQEPNTAEDINKQFSEIYKIFTDLNQAIGYSAQQSQQDQQQIGFKQVQPQQFNPESSDVALQNKANSSGLPFIMTDQQQSMQDKENGQTITTKNGRYFINNQPITHSETSQQAQQQQMEEKMLQLKAKAQNIQMKIEKQKIA